MKKREILGVPLVFFLIYLSVFVLLIIVGIITVLLITNDKDKTEAKDVSTFANCQELADRLNKVDDIYYPLYTKGGIAVDDMAVEEAPASTNSSSRDSDISQTNVQVQGVDEADIVKTDGDYIYTIYDRRLYILDAKTMEEKSNVLVKGTPQEIFLSDDKIVVYSVGMQVSEITNRYWGHYDQVGIFVYDVSNKSSIKLDREITLDGNYQTARKIDNYIYLVSRYDFYKAEDVTVDRLDEILPKYKDSKTSDEEMALAECSEINFFGDTGKNFVNILALDLDSENLAKKILFGNVETVYMSLDNLYLAGTEYEYVDEESSGEGSCDSVNGLLGTCTIEPSIVPIYQQTSDKTGIYRFSVEGLDLKFETYGSVPGYLLNQFSLDENEDYLRVATTSTDANNWSTESSNNLYVLDVNNLSQKGEVENLAVGEKIYSIRFLGDRAYMVTFKSIDPLFVIDLSSPEKPKVLGELKIPGYSDYLHPYDENHIIGVGKAAESISEDWALQQGVKIALFDVSDVTKPVEVDNVVIGDRGSDSAVLQNHKAFLFDKEKELLVIPATIAEVDYKDLNTKLQATYGNDSQVTYRIDSGIVYVFSKTENANITTYLQSLTELEDVSSKSKITTINNTTYEYVYQANIKDVDLYTYGEINFSGFVVYKITDEVISERARLGETLAKDKYVYDYEGKARSLYIDDTLYTLNSGKVNSYNLETLQAEKELKLEGYK